MLKRMANAPNPAQPAPSFGLTDAATADDKLGYQLFADRLAASIAGVDRANTPWTIGVYGTWGSGKTSFLMMTAAALSEKWNIEPIWFNAWKYTREEDLWLALIQTILERANISGRLRAPVVKLRIWARSIDIRSGAWEVIRRLAVLLLRIVLLVLAVLMFASLGGSGTHSPVDSALTSVLGHHPAVSNLLASPSLKLLVAIVALLASNPASFLQMFSIRLGIDFSKFSRRTTYRDKIAFLDQFSKDFSDIVRIVCRDKPLVIIIDDLDRCLPDQTLQILETVKLFLDVRGCVFLLAVDREIVEQAVAVRYKDMPQSASHLRIGETYFEKVVQLPFSLPPAADSKVSEFIADLAADEAVRACIPILRGPAPYNPRRIKRSIQTFGLLRDFAASALPDGNLVPPLLAKLVVLQAYYREVYEAALDKPSLLGQLELQYRNGAAAAAGADPMTATLARRYEESYPALVDLLRLEVTTADSFVGAQLVDYLTFVRNIVVEAPTPPEPPVTIPSTSGSASPRPATILVSFIDVDFRWAEWILQQLTQSGYMAALRPVTADADPADMPVYDFIMAVLSEASTESADFKRSLAVASAVGVQVLPVRVESCEIPELIANAPVIDLATMGQSDSARLTLLSGIPAAARLQGDVASPATAGISGGVQVGDYAVQTNIYTAPAFPGRRSASITNVPPYYADILSRPAEIGEIADFFASMRSLDAPAICAIVGLAGSGKSTIAGQYARDFARGAPVIWWLRCTDSETMLSDFTNLAAELQILGPTQQPHSMAAAVLTRLTDLADWIIVYDDIADPASIEYFLPRSGTGKVLLTSRDRSISRYARHTVNLSVLSTEESVRLLQEMSGSNDVNALGALAIELGGLPLALQQAGQVMKESAVPPSQYLNQYLSNPARRLGPSDAFSESILTTLTLSLEQIRHSENSEFATAIVRLMAFLAPTEAPRDLVLAGVRYALSDNGKRYDDVDLDDSLGLLRRYSLVGLTPSGVSMHRLVQQAVRLGLAPEETSLYAASALTATLKVAPSDPADPETWPTLAVLAEHIQAAAGHAEEQGVELNAVCAAREELAEYQLSRGFYSSALKTAEQCLKVAEPIYGSASSEVARIHTLLAHACRVTGDLVRARSEQEVALDIQERVLGQDNPEIAISLSNLASILDDLGDLATARTAQERALTIQAQEYGSQSPQVAAGLSNLSRILLDLGDLATARTAQEQALAVQESVLGSESPGIAISLSNLARIELSQGDLTSAKAAQERALAIQERAIGPDHPDVAASLANLARIELGLDHLPTALAAQERALAIQEQALGHEHPDVATSLSIQASLLRYGGDFAGAQEAQERALAIQERAFGPDHPVIAEGLTNLAGILLNAGNLSAARELQQRAIDIQERTLGMNRGGVATSLANLAVILDGQGDIEAGRAARDRAVAIDPTLAGRMGWPVDESTGQPSPDPEAV